VAGVPSPPPPPHVKRKFHAITRPSNQLASHEPNITFEKESQGIYSPAAIYVFSLSLSIVLFDLDNFLLVQARLVVVHLIFFLLGRNPPTATFGHFLAPPNG
jgi:hypothetical protein